MGEQAPDFCALPSIFTSGLPSPLIDHHTYSPLQEFSVNPSVKRQDTRREHQEAE
ncbi:hypothetical protein BDN67DRAFT_974690 [Paxillus ammoniavirescens]|nr:hypothetical protein BDN67DRAFT_974690 [Paxillus ammoniavirescens]